jgi:hypothetical protein
VALRLGFKSRPLWVEAPSAGGIGTSKYKWMGFAAKFQWVLIPKSRPFKVKANGQVTKFGMQCLFLAIFNSPKWPFRARKANLKTKNHYF